MFILTAIACFIVVFSCEKGENDPTSESEYTGNWTCSYGNGTYGLSFSVNDDGEVIDLFLTDYASCGGSCPDAGGELSTTQAVKINKDGTFYIKVYLNDPDNGVVSISDSISARFIDKNTVEGGFSSSYVLTNCGLCFGGTMGMVDFTGSNDCTYVPEKGESAGRFCN